MNYSEANTKERVRREVVILTDEERDTHSGAAAHNLSDDDQEEDGEQKEEQESGTPWLMITTGKILTEGSLPYHRYFIAIAIMCFFSIFLTFMSLNADREDRQRER